MDTKRIAKIRFREEPKELLTVSLPAKVADRLRHEAVDNDWSISHEVAVHLCRAYGLEEEWLKAPDSFESSASA